MGFFDRFKGKKEVSPIPQAELPQPTATPEKVINVAIVEAPKKVRKPRTKKVVEPEQAIKKTAKKTTKKAKVTAEEPYIKVVEVTFDKNNPRYGSFEFDFNQAFVVELMKAGYQGKEDSDIVENWFTDVCRNVAMETYEQDVAQTPGLARKMKVKNISNTHRSVE